MSTPTQTIDCHCGFTVTGPDAAANHDVYAEHECLTGSPVRWFDAVFSFWGAAMVFLIAAAVVHVLTGKGWLW